MMLTEIRRLLCKCRGEELLLVAFWPRDYALHKVYTVGGQEYRITRYLRATDQRFFEVWGKAATARVGAPLQVELSHA